MKFFSLPFLGDSQTSLTAPRVQSSEIHRLSVLVSDLSFFSRAYSTLLGASFSGSPGVVVRVPQRPGVSSTSCGGPSWPAGMSATKNENSFSGHIFIWSIPLRKIGGREDRAGTRESLERERWAPRQLLLNGGEA